MGVTLAKLSFSVRQWRCCRHQLQRWEDTIKRNGFAEQRSKGACWPISHWPYSPAALTNLGIAQQELGRLDEAETTVRRALEIFSRTLGPDHPNTQQAMAALDRILADKD